MSPNRPQRADARRNRAHILEVASQVFAERGLSIPVSEIARAVGVGVGTVYRHFPTKEDLFAAIVVDRVQRLIDHARALAARSDPGGAFKEYFEYLVHESLRDRTLFEALSQAARLDLRPSTELGGALVESQRALLVAAQRSGDIRPDLDVADLKPLMAGCATMARHSDDPSHMVAIVYSGLEARD